MFKKRDAVAQALAPGGYLCQVREELGASSGALEHHTVFFNVDGAYSPSEEEECEGSATGQVHLPIFKGNTLRAMMGGKLKNKKLYVYWVEQAVEKLVGILDPKPAAATSITRKKPSTVHAKLHYVRCSREGGFLRGPAGYSAWRPDADIM